MLINLEKVKKLETNTTNFLKRIMKIYQEIAPEKDLYVNKLDSNVGPKNIDIFLRKFEWDDVRYPRSSSLFDQIKHIEEKLQNMQKNLKSKYQNYHDSKVIVQSSQVKKETLTNFINQNLDECILKMVKDTSNSIKAETFINSDNLCSYIVYVPMKNYDRFKATYEQLDDFIVPGSFVELEERHNYMMGTFVAFKKSEDNLKVLFKQELTSIIKKYTFDIRKAEESRQKKE